MESVELKRKIIEVKTPRGTQQWLELEEERISKLEYRSTEIIDQAEKQRKEKGTRGFKMAEE